MEHFNKTDLIIKNEWRTIVLTHDKKALNAPQWGKRSLSELYEHCSMRKRGADNYVQEIIEGLHGYNAHYIGNCMTFSVGFNFRKNGKKYIGYITKGYNRYFEA